MKRLMIVVALLTWVGVAFALDHVAPNNVTNVTVNTGKTTAVVHWTAPGDKCGNATCAEYELRYSTSSFDECNFEFGTQVSTTPPQSPGSQECFEVSGLTCNRTYYFAVRVKDSAGNWSVLSNVASGTTRTCPINPEVLCE